MCFGSNSTAPPQRGPPRDRLDFMARMGRRFRVDLALHVGEMGVDYSEVARKEHLTQLEVEVRAGGRRLVCLRRKNSTARATPPTATPHHARTPPNPQPAGAPT